MSHAGFTLPPPPISDTVRVGRSAISWQRALAAAIRDPAELLSRLNLPDSLVPAAQRAARLFPLLVPESYVQRMLPGDVHDPLLRQVLPLDLEEESPGDFVADPVDDEAARRAPGLLQKYAGRVLLMTTGACAIHCRYCFRREYPYSREPKHLDDWQPALAAIAADSSIHEVILSGGDPLTLTNARLTDLIAALEHIPHLRRLRVHTRLPIVLPERVDSGLLAVLAPHRLQTILVIHANHARELTGACVTALQALRQQGITLLNQTVLLRGVNDQLAALCELCERLVDLGVLPYYLHQLDRVRGAAHFEVSISRGRELVAELRRQLPGYAVPTYVSEYPGQPSKTPLEILGEHDAWL